MTFSYKTLYLDKPIITDRALDIFVPENITQDISMVFVHGGGWRAGSRQQMHKIMEGFCDIGFICASFDYSTKKIINGRYRLPASELEYVREKQRNNQCV